MAGWHPDIPPYSGQINFLRAKYVIKPHIRVVTLLHNSTLLDISATQILTPSPPDTIVIGNAMFF